MSNLLKRAGKLGARYLNPAANAVMTAWDLAQVVDAMTRSKGGEGGPVPMKDIREWLEKSGERMGHGQQFRGDRIPSLPVSGSQHMMRQLGASEKTMKRDINDLYLDNLRWDEDVDEMRELVQALQDIKKYKRSDKEPVKAMFSENIALRDRLGLYTNPETKDPSLDSYDFDRIPARDTIWMSVLDAMKRDKE